jgi:hypothetical protein
VIALFALWISAARGGDLPSVALVPLDAAPGTASDDLERFVRGLAGAVQRGGEIVPLVDDELAGQLGDSARLKEARDAFSEGRKFLATGDADVAVTFLEEAVNGHRDADSDIVRRGEMADAHWAFARALVATDDRDRAKTEVRRALILVPDYVDTRADMVDAELERLVSEAVRSLEDRPPRRMTEENAARLGASLAIDCIVYGSVDAGGAVSLAVQVGPEVVWELARPGPFAPPGVADKWYRSLGDEVTDACLGREVTATVAEAPPPREPEPAGPARPEPTGGSRSRTVTWLAIGGAGVLAAGAATAVVLTTTNPPVVEPEPTWTLTITPP